MFVSILALAVIIGLWAKKYGKNGWLWGITSAITLPFVMLGIV